MATAVSYDFDDWTGKPCQKDPVLEKNDGQPKCPGFETCWLGPACDLPYKTSRHGNPINPTKPKQGLAV